MRVDVESSQARAAVGDRLDALFTRWSGEQAVQFTEDGDRRWYGWGDLAVAHRALAGVLDGHRVADGAAIAIVMRQRPVMVATELSVLTAGCTALLVTPLQGDRTLGDDLAALRPAVIVAHSTDWERMGVQAAVARSGALGVEVDDDFGVFTRIAPATLQPGPELHAAATVLTSGTTGRAKRLPVPWESFVRLGGGPEGRPPRSERGALILSVPLVTLGGMMSIARLIFGGRPISMMERFDVRTWAELVKEHRPTIIGAPPPVVKMILDADISADHFEGVTAYHTSSAPVAPDVAMAFERRYGIPVLLGYGATEFLDSVTGWTTDLWAEYGARKLGSAGRPHPGARLRVIDPATLDDASPTVMAAGEAGILEVDPPQRAGDLPPGWLRTADRARIDDDGFLWILGRVDDVIVRGGFKVDLTEIETALVAHPAISAACAVGLPDERLGQVPAALAAVDTLERGSAPTEGELLDWVRDHLAPYAVPTVIRVVDEIPTTITLKPHRAKAQELLQDG